MAELHVPFDLIAGHVLFEAGGARVLLDTGSPVTVGRVPSFRLLDRAQPLDAAAGARQVDEIVRGLSELDGVPRDFGFDVLLGLDVLAGCALRLCWSERTLHVAPPPAGSAAAPGRMFLRERIAVSGRELEAIVDTGAWLSYVTSSRAEDLPPAGVARDYNPVLGALTPELRRALVTVRGRTIESAVGVAAPLLGAVLALAGVEAIVGTDLLSRAGDTALQL